MKYRELCRWCRADYYDDARARCVRCGEHQLPTEAKPAGRLYAGNDWVFLGWLTRLPSTRIPLPAEVQHERAAELLRLLDLVSVWRDGEHYYLPGSVRSDVNTNEASAW